jgi:hypothetical protein
MALSSAALQTSQTKLITPKNNRQATVCLPFRNKKDFLFIYFFDRE